MEFTKLQATGNDFILIDAFTKGDPDSLFALGGNKPRGDILLPELARAMCDRHYGVGADGLLLLLKSKVADFRMRMFNPDGSEAEVCGNGLRCVAKYIAERISPAPAQELTIETIVGIRKVKSYSGNQFQVDMGIPRFRAEEIPLSSRVDITPILDYPLNIDGWDLLLTFVSIGNPHGVCFLAESVADFPLPELGAKIERHPLFPQRLNFEVVNILSPRKIRARVWERGVGETLACGSGACAIAVAAQLHHYVDNEVDVILPGGTLSVAWDGRGEVYLKGSAELVFTGKWMR